MTSYDDDDLGRGEWCRDFQNHDRFHAFCGPHQTMWCRTCEGETCPECVDDPRCRLCGAAIFEEYHDWDCPDAD